ncbi:hypothetical protein ACFRAR_27885 [Kitasatospora sp. NPDC056651]|uniref:hypothetical protein n=1 Tax=Kitasatospora sp. NPDC056651 TaxID=3345892 RepID=UPI0036C869B6
MTRTRLAFLYAALGLIIPETVVLLWLGSAAVLASGGLGPDDRGEPASGHPVLWGALTLAAAITLNVLAVRQVSRMGMPGERVGLRRAALTGTALVQLGVIAVGARMESALIAAGPALVLVAVAPLAARLASDARVRG